MDARKPNVSVSPSVLAAGRRGLQRRSQLLLQLQGLLRWRGPARPCLSPPWPSACPPKRTVSSSRPHRPGPGAQRSGGGAASTPSKPSHPGSPRRAWTSGPPPSPALSSQHRLRPQRTAAVTAAPPKPPQMWRRRLTPSSCARRRSLRRKRGPSFQQRALPGCCWGPGAAAGPQQQQQHPAASIRADISQWLPNTTSSLSNLHPPADGGRVLLKLRPFLEIICYVKKIF